MLVNFYNSVCWFEVIYECFGLIKWNNNSFNFFQKKKNSIGFSKDSGFVNTGKKFSEILREKERFF